MRWSGILCAAVLLLGCRDGANPVPGGDASTGAETTSPDEATSTSGVDDSTGASSTGDGGDPPDPIAEYLSPTDHLIRASLALRGIRPELEELEAVAADPDTLPDFVDAYLESKEFGATIRDLHNEAWLLRAFVRPDLHGYPANLLASKPAGAGDVHVSAQAQEMPLRLIEHVVMSDRPYSDIVTADYTVANGITAEIYGLDYNGNGKSWEETAWEGRPSAGVLSESMVFYRHKSMPSNANRGRANAVTRALLCLDFSELDITFDGAVDLSDEDAVADAIKENPSCSGCHVALDPVASFLYGWEPFRLAQFDGYPHDAYFTQLEDTWNGGGIVQPTDAPPALFGREGDSIADLGQLIAEHGDFSRCAATRFYGYLTQTPLEAVPSETTDGLDDVFVESGLDAKELSRAIVLSDAFRVSHALPDTDADELIGYQRLRPRQLGRAIKALTGFELKVRTDPNFGEFHVLEDSFLGYESLAGGIDSYYVTTPTHTMNPTSSLVFRQMAAAAASAVVASDFAQPPGNRRLLGLVETDTTDEAQLREQLVALHLLVLGEAVEPNDAAVDETFELFSEFNNPTTAWTITIAAMLQDVRFIHY